MVDGRYEPNAGCYLLDWAYGGVKLSRMSSKDGCTGQSDPISMGFSTKKSATTPLIILFQALKQERG